jgi:hypothetical protein
MTHETISQSTLPRRRFSDWCARAAAALAVVIAITATVHAEVRVNGDAADVQLDARQSNVGEVLSALQTTCGLRVKTSTALDRPVSGTFTGSPSKILSRVLQGYNYFIRYGGTEIELTVIGLQGDRAAALARPPPPPTPAVSLSEAVRLKVNGH